MACDNLEYEHKCKGMPDEMEGIYKHKDSLFSVATVRKYVMNSVFFETAIYGFLFCPYCGEKLGGDA